MLRIGPLLAVALVSTTLALAFTPTAEAMTCTAVDLLDPTVKLVCGVVFSVIRDVNVVCEWAVGNDCIVLL